MGTHLEDTKDTLSVLYTVDNNFVPQLAAGIHSICSSNQDFLGIRFYVFSNGISVDNQDALKGYVASLGREIVFIDIVGFMRRLGFDFDTSGWNEIVMSRLLMNQFLPKELDRVLYLDGDTIVRRSLRELWDTPLDDYVLAAAMEPTCDASRLDKLSLAGRPYYNAGVLLVNLKKWRESSAEARLLAYCKDRAGNLFANDQDAINAVLKDEIKPCSSSYNSYNSLAFYNYKMLNELMPSYNDETSYEEAIHDPYIVHYLGEERPWRKGNAHVFRDDYLNNLNATPWAGAGIEEGWETYFLIWNAFNHIFVHAPRVRYSIITKAIPLFISFRAYMRRAK